MSTSIVKISSFEKIVTNSLINIPNDNDNNKKLSMLIIVLLEILYKNNTDIKNKICNYLMSKNILDDEILSSEYSKLKYVLEKMFVNTEQKLIKNNENKVYSENNVYRENYEELNKIADSSFGNVYKVYHKFEDNYYAMKKIFITEELLNLNYNFFKEVQIFSKLYHPNVVRYYTSFIILDEKSIDDYNNYNEISNYNYIRDIKYSNSIINNDNSDNTDDETYLDIENKINNTTSILFIQMELCDCTFRDYINNNMNNNDIIVKLNYFLEILYGIQYLHSLKIIHRDIKPTNIYMLNNVIKIGDFGLSTTNINNQEELLMSNDIGTDFYNAPEIDTGIYNQKIDIYSCGKIFLELLIIASTYCEKYTIIKKIIHNNENNLSNEKYIDDKYNDIVKKSLIKNVEQRYNIDEFIYDIKTVIKLLH